MKNLIYILLIVFLLLCAVMGVFRKKTKRFLNVIHIIVPGILLVTVMYFWVFPLWSFPETTGRYDIASVFCTYIDESRVETYEKTGAKRWLNVKIWYPQNYTQDNYTCPLIVFSHGSFGIKESNESLYRELASHGYIVCAIDHTYQCLSTVDANGAKVKLDNSYMKQVMTASDSDVNKRERLFELFGEWMQIRTGDINFVIDKIIDYVVTGDNGANGVYRLIDVSNIGVMGHSLGGAAALGIGRMRKDIGAVIALEAPFMCDVKDIKNGVFIFEESAYPVPLLNVYTDSLWDIIADSPQYAQNYAILNDDCNTTYDIYIKGAGHMTLTDLAYSMPPLCLIFGQHMFFNVDEYAQKINQTYLDFFDSYLKGKNKYVPISF